jgi:CRP-like cAMP-binding protein
MGLLLMDDKELEEGIKQIIELSSDDLDFLMSCAQKCDYKKGDQLLKEGEIGRSFFWVVAGYLRTYYNKDGIAINLNFTFENNFAANIKSYQGKQPSELIIEAGEDAQVWVFNLNQLSGSYEDHPQVAKFVRRTAIRLLLAAEAHSDRFRIYTPTERYQYIQDHNPQLLQRIPLSQLASYIGVARETLSRIRGKNN